MSRLASESRSWEYTGMFHLIIELLSLDRSLNSSEFQFSFWYNGYNMSYWTIGKTSLDNAWESRLCSWVKCSLQGGRCWVWKAKPWVRSPFLLLALPLTFGKFPSFSEPRVSHPCCWEPQHLPCRALPASRGLDLHRGSCPSGFFSYRMECVCIWKEGPLGDVWAEGVGWKRGF